MLNYDIDAEYIKQQVLLSDLQTAEDVLIGKYLTRAIRMLESYIDTEQFYQEPEIEGEAWTYLLPGDLKDALVYIVEYLYSHEGDFGKAEMKSEKIWNYQYTKKEENWKLLDLPLNILSLLQRYRTCYGTIEPSIADLDREYTD